MSVGSVDAQIRAVGHRLHQDTLVRDGLVESLFIRRQWVAATGFAESVDERLIACIDVDQFYVERHFVQGIEHFGETRQVPRGVAGIDTNRYATVVRQIALIDELREVQQQAGGHVVDAIKAGVFERVQRYRFSCAG